MAIPKVTKTPQKLKVLRKITFFSQFTRSFKGKNNSDNIKLSVQDVSNDKYLKLYRIQSNLVDYKEDTLESGINFTHEKEICF